MAHSTDVFLSHNWGKDEISRNNHVHVSFINKELQKYGYLTWFDEEQLTIEIFSQIVDGIDNTEGVIAFSTKGYYDKVIGKEAGYSGKLEFDYAAKK